MPTSSQVRSEQPKEGCSERQDVSSGQSRRRKKQPAVVRRQLLDITAFQLVNGGNKALTLESVARAAGISKGGLFHHFPSKRELLEALFDDLLERLEEKVTTLMAQDETYQGCFSRAYLKALINLSPDEEIGSTALLHLVLSKDPDLRQRMTDWTTRLLRQNAASESFPQAHMLRYAADGLWLSMIIDARDAFPEERQATYEQLLALTYPRWE